jgi:hypothetical protein
MNIGLYGHSIASWQRQDTWSYITKIKNLYNANIVNFGVAQCSEERILFELKKTKKLDLAIIFHSNPDFMFVPSQPRDYCTFDRDNLLAKVPSGKVRDWFKLNGYVNIPDVYCDWWEAIPNSASFELLKQFDITPQMYEENLTEMNNLRNSTAFNEWCNDNNKMIRDLIKQKVPSEQEVQYWLDMFDLLELNKKYLYHHDLQMNRYYGALIQIDQYLKARNIPAVHCLGKPFWYPSWFKFSSGITNSEIFKLQHEITGHHASFKESENSMSIEGNQMAFDLLLPLILQAFEKVK